MTPIDFKQANDLLCAAPGTEAEVTDLPVCRFNYGWNLIDGGQNVVASCWRLTWWERLQVAVTGRVFLQVYGRTHPPLLLSTELPRGLPTRTEPLPPNPRRGPPVHPNCKCATPAEAGAECKRPPAGWRCTREAGHDGPCAAIGDDE